MFKQIVTGILGSLLCMGSMGCFHLFTIHSAKKEKIVREKEARNAVAFENSAATDQFNAEYKSRLNNRTIKDNGGGNFGILFICNIDDDGTVTKLSPNAVYNDSIDACDLDRDGVITETEARQFAHKPN